MNKSNVQQLVPFSKPFASMKTVSCHSVEHHRQDKPVNGWKNITNVQHDVLPQIKKEINIPTHSATIRIN